MAELLDGRGSGPGQEQDLFHINIAGLAIGMAACIMILLYVRYENSYDNWLPDADNTYQFQAWYPNPQSGIPLFGQMSAYVTKDRVKKDFPQVERVGYLLSGQPVIMKDGQSSFGDDYGYHGRRFPQGREAADAVRHDPDFGWHCGLSQSEAIRRSAQTRFLGGR